MEKVEDAYYRFLKFKDFEFNFNNNEIPSQTQNYFNRTIDFNTRFKNKEKFLQKHSTLDNKQIHHNLYRILKSKQSHNYHYTYQQVFPKIIQYSNQSEQEIQINNNKNIFRPNLKLNKRYKDHSTFKSHLHDNQDLNISQNIRKHKKNRKISGLASPPLVIMNKDKVNLSLNDQWREYKKGMDTIGSYFFKGDKIIKKKFKKLVNYNLSPFIPHSLQN